jgi:hypothetical protein
VSQNEYLGSAVAEDLSLWDGQKVVFRLSFDAYGVLTVEGWNARTGAPVAVNVERTRPIEEILTGLGQFSGPAPETWQMPASGIGQIFGRLFKGLRP